MDIVTASPIFLLVTLAATWLMTFAYKNTKFALKHKVELLYLTSPNNTLEE